MEWFRQLINWQISINTLSTLNTLIDRDDLYDGLHMDYIGKDKFAAAVADLVLSWDLE